MTEDDRRDESERLRRLAGLRDDQRRRWLAGDRRPAEAYLEQTPALAADPEAAVDVIYSEFLLREQLGERPLAEEYLGRFPHLADALRRQFDLHFAMLSVSPTWQGGEPPEDEPTPIDKTEIIPAAGATDLPDYELLGELGRGGMGVVYKARQLSLKRVVALKMLTAGLQAGPEPLARFRGEAELIARLRHPDIVPIYEAGENDGRPYFAMEFLEGGSLARKLAVAPLEPSAAARLVQAVAGAVQHAHERGVIHRDLKPSNILLGADGSPRVADFGLAKSFGGEAEDAPTACRTETGALLGTPAYMAPEQVASGKHVGPAADVYALGAILYECLTGRPPFRAASLLETLEQVRSAEPPPPGRLQPGLPRDLQTICLKCLHKEPARRYASARELADDLGRLLQGEPIRARPVSARERLRKWARRKPALAGLLLVSALSLAALVPGGLVYNVRLRAALKEAEDNAETARLQEARADAAYRAAADTLNRMLDHLHRQRSGEAPPFEDVRRQQLEDALAFYQDILGRADSAADPRVRLDTAVASRRAADVQQMLGRQEPAAANYRRAIGLLERLPAGALDTAQNQLMLAESYENLGLLIAGSEQPGEAERCHRTALGIHERMARLRPDDPLPRAGMAESEHNLGVFCQTHGKPDEALTHYTRAATLRADLVHDHPDDENFQAALANAYVNLALLHQMNGRENQAWPNYQNAEALLSRIVQRHPPGGESALSLSTLYVNWAYLLWNTGLQMPALVKSKLAVDLAEGVLKEQPQYRRAIVQARSAHGARAEFCDAIPFFWATAANDWDRVVELEDPPGVWWHRTLRALALARTGQHARVGAEAESLGEEKEAPTGGLFILVRACGIAVGAAQADGRLALTERAEGAKRNAGQAIGLLRKLKARGYFKEASHVESLRTLPDLQPLRGRPDFDELLREP